MRILLLSLVYMIGLAGTPWAQSSDEEAAHSAGWHQKVKIEGTFSFCGEPVPLHDPVMFEAFEKELLLTAWDQPQVLLWLKRANRIFPHIEKELSKRGLPDDLKYIAVVESALRPHIRSHKNAVGYWQFIKSTAKHYGLRVDQYIDQRRNLFDSTDAALRYLSDLYNKFDSWTLAAAAYNSGEKRVVSEMKLQGIEDFYQLYLPLETQRYIYKIVAAKEVMSKPEEYGYHLTPAELYRPLEFDRVTVESKKALPVTVIAQAARSYYKEIKTLNPEIRGHYLVRGTHTLLIPKGAGKEFHQRLKGEGLQTMRFDENVYVVKPGDTLFGIAKKLGVPMRTLLAWNNISPKKQIYPGDRLILGTKQ